MLPSKHGIFSGAGVVLLVSWMVDIFLLPDDLFSHEI